MAYMKPALNGTLMVTPYNERQPGSGPSQNDNIYLKKSLGVGVPGI